MSEKDIFILDASREKPDGTVEQLSDEEARTFFMPPQDQPLMKDGTVAITWIEGTPAQLLTILCGFPLFEEEVEVIGNIYENPTLVQEA